MIFYLCLDALIFLSQDPENVISVHCKAGKGRTGYAISSYISFMEGSKDAYKSIKMFNERRTNDSKGLRVASQLRYVHYFNHFLNSTFKRPFKQLIAPYIRNSKVFEPLFKPQNILKL